jgi:hypothetical protein
MIHLAGVAGFLDKSLAHAVRSKSRVPNGFFQL